MQSNMALDTPGKPMRGLFTYCIAVLVMMSSCQKILFNDSEETRTILPGEFSSARIKGICDLVLVQDSTDRIVISGSNNISSIKAGVLNDTLVIDDGGGFSLNPGKNTIELHFTRLDYLVTYDPVNLTNKGVLKADRLSWDGIGEIAEASLVLDCNLFIFCNSANTLGFVKLSGRVETLIVFNRYGSSVLADGLSCRYADITNESAGDVYVNASERLVAYIWGPGNIYYQGDPVTDIREAKGTGNLIKFLP